MPFSLLVVEDSEQYQKLIQAALEPDYRVTIFSSGNNLLSFCKEHQFDLILLDVELPGIDGFEICTQLRKLEDYIDTPIIFLSGKSKVEEKILGLECGGNDYVTKPFHQQELKARIRANLRSPKAAKHPDSHPIGLDLKSRRISIDGTVATSRLTQLEFKTLSYLLKHLDQVISREQILNAVWPPGTHVSDRTIDSHISKIRKKLGTRGHLIESIHGVGYQLVKGQPTSKAG